MAWSERRGEVEVPVAEMESRERLPRRLPATLSWRSMPWAAAALRAEKRIRPWRMGRWARAATRVRRPAILRARLSLRRGGVGAGFGEGAACGADAMGAGMMPEPAGAARGAPGD